jgi:hypothetical protein
MRAAGIPVDKLSEAQQKVLADLSDQGVATIMKVRERLQAAGAGEVEAPRSITSQSPETCATPESLISGTQTPSGPHI